MKKHNRKFEMKKSFFHNFHISSAEMHSHHGFASCAENVPCGLIKSTKSEKSDFDKIMLFSFSFFLGIFFSVVRLENIFEDPPDFSIELNYTTSVRQRASVLSATAGSGDAWTGGASAARVSERA